MSEETRWEIRKQHVEWAKSRALEYVDRGDLNGAIASLVSDLRKNQDTANHIGIILAPGALLDPRKNAQSIRKFIEDFN